MPQVSEPVHLNCQLWDGATDKFVRAFLFDDEGLAFNASDLKELMIRISTKVHDLYREVHSLNDQFKQISDDELKLIFEAGQSADPGGDVGAFRAWQASIVGYADNYVNKGEVSDKSFEIAKRVKLPL